MQSCMHIRNDGSEAKRIMSLKVVVIRKSWRARATIMIGSAEDEKKRSEAAT